MMYIVHRTYYMRIRIVRPTQINTFNFIMIIFSCRNRILESLLWSNLLTYQAGPKIEGNSAICDGAKISSGQFKNYYLILKFVKLCDFFVINFF